MSPFLWNKKDLKEREISFFRKSGPQIEWDVEIQSALFYDCKGTFMYYIITKERGGGSENGNF